LLFSTSLHVTTPLQPYLLHPPQHHPHNNNSNGGHPHSHHHQQQQHGQSQHQQLLPVCPMPAIDSVIYGLEASAINGGDGGRSGFFINELCMTLQDKRLD
jgi:hypothetical protein